MIEISFGAIVSVLVVIMVCLFFGVLGYICGNVMRKLTRIEHKIDDLEDDLDDLFMEVVTGQDR